MSCPAIKPIGEERAYSQDRPRVAQDRNLATISCRGHETLIGLHLREVNPNRERAEGVMQRWDELNT